MLVIFSRRVGVGDKFVFSGLNVIWVLFFIDFSFVRFSFIRYGIFMCRFFSEIFFSLF